MLEPVILRDEIIDQARAWRDRCLSRWHRRVGREHEVGRATVLSPVDGLPRKVVIYLSCGLRARALTCPPGGNPDEPESYCIAVDADRDTNCDQRVFLAVLLHELTHAIDPYFDADCAGRRLSPPLSEYDLPSEQRAFTAMWIDFMRELVDGGHFRAGAFPSRLRRLSPEFDGFYGYGQIGRPHVVDQMNAHYRAMERHLKAKAARG